MAYWSKKSNKVRSKTCLLKKGFQLFLPKHRQRNLSILVNYDVVNAAKQKTIYTPVTWVEKGRQS